MVQQSHALKHRVGQQPKGRLRRCWLCCSWGRHCSCTRGGISESLASLLLHCQLITSYAVHAALQLHKYDDPVLTTADIHKKRDVVERVCKPIASKPPPKKEAPAPAPQPAAAPQAAAAAEGEATPMDADAAAPAAEDTPMEQ